MILSVELLEKKINELFEVRLPYEGGESDEPYLDEVDAYLTAAQSMTWDTIDVQLLTDHCSAITFFSPKLCAYLLPALMLITLREEGDDYHAVRQRLLAVLSPLGSVSVEERDKWLRNLWDELRPCQRVVVADFLLWMAISASPADLDRDDAVDALRGFWSCAWAEKGY